MGPSPGCYFSAKRFSLTISIITLIDGEITPAFFQHENNYGMKIDTYF